MSSFQGPVLLEKSHDYLEFDCGKEPLNTFLTIRETFNIEGAVWDVTPSEVIESLYQLWLENIELNYR